MLFYCKFWIASLKSPVLWYHSHYLVLNSTLCFNFLVLCVEIFLVIFYLLVNNRVSKWLAACSSQFSWKIAFQFAQARLSCPCFSALLVTELLFQSISFSNNIIIYHFLFLLQEFANSQISPSTYYSGYKYVPKLPSK